MCYKIFARIIYNRLRGGLDAQQSEEQMGFRPSRSTEDACLILEEAIGKSFEFKMPLWFACLDLSKAFDKIEWKHLFHALREQGVPDKYRSSLAAMYEGQVGTIGQLGQFHVKRGVKQGDVLSPMLFNAGLEMAIRRWKERLDAHGLLQGNRGDTSRLTNVRFADDLIVYSNDEAKLGEMLEVLAEDYCRDTT